ncbi:MAG: LysR family transcriptional regulator, partial [Candidatus Marsarchaeota archaeon]|nr:LysR family transcriptional regulator [Candidatus Marsarchaeota archaeon]
MGRFQLNLHHVISFYFLAREQSFSRAAEKLSITQPAITQHVHGLEVQFGVKLVNVKKKRVQLTKAGERLLLYAEELLNQAVMTENFLKSYRYNNLSVGIASPLVMYLTALVDKFKELHPSIGVSIREGPSLAMVDELLDFKLDVCLIGVLSPYSERLRLYRIPVDERLFFVASPEYPLPVDAPITWAELVSHPLIIQSEGSASRAIVLHHFKKRGLQPLIGAEVNNIEMGKELARQKKGVALMFEPNIRDEVARGVLRLVELEGGDIRMGAIDV